jgi:adenylate kinase
VEPNIIVFLDISLEESVERQAGRVTDPVTGEVYHMKFKPPPTDEIRQRIEKRSTDNVEKAKIRYEAYKKSGWNSAEEFATNYPKVSVHCLDASSSMDEIFGDIKDEIEKLNL